MLNHNRRTEEESRRDLVKFGRWLYRLGFMPGTSGNLSVRLDSERILATPTGTSKYLLKTADMVIVDLEGRHIQGSRKVTSEIGMHLEIYWQRSDVEAVIHSHPPIATAFACVEWPLDEMFCQEAVMTLGAVPLAEYATTGTSEVAASMAPFIAGHEAILIANHGAVTYGDNLVEACLRMETLEHVAHIRHLANQLGDVRNLDQKQVRGLINARERYRRNIA